MNEKPEAAGASDLEASAADVAGLKANPETAEASDFLDSSLGVAGLNEKAEVAVELTGASDALEPSPVVVAAGLNASPVAAGVSVFLPSSELGVAAGLKANPPKADASAGLDVSGAAAEEEAGLKANPENAGLAVVLDVSAEAGDPNEKPVAAGASVDFEVSTDVEGLKEKAEVAGISVAFASEADAGKVLVSLELLAGAAAPNENAGAETAAADDGVEAGVDAAGFANENDEDDEKLVAAPNGLAAELVAGLNEKAGVLDVAAPLVASSSFESSDFSLDLDPKRDISKAGLAVTTAPLDSDVCAAGAEDPKLNDGAEPG